MNKNLKERILQRIYEILSQEDFGEVYNVKGEREDLQELEILTNLLNSLQGDAEYTPDYNYVIPNVVSTPYKDNNTTCTQCDNFKRAMASGGPLICNSKYK